MKQYQSWYNVVLNTLDAISVTLPNLLPLKSVQDTARLGRSPVFVEVLDSNKEKPGQSHENHWNPQYRQPIEVFRPGLTFLRSSSHRPFLTCGSHEGMTTAQSQRNSVQNCCNLNFLLLHNNFYGLSTWTTGKHIKTWHPQHQSTPCISKKTTKRTLLPMGLALLLHLVSKSLLHGL